MFYYIFIGYSAIVATLGIARIIQYRYQRVMEATSKALITRKDGSKSVDRNIYLQYYNSFDPNGDWILEYIAFSLFWPIHISYLVIHKGIMKVASIGDRIAHRKILAEIQEPIKPQPIPNCDNCGFPSRTSPMR